MACVKNLVRIKVLGKKKCRKVYRRVKAAIKKAMGSGSKEKLKFQYDPHSYALNFDDGFDHKDSERGPQQLNFEEKIIWVYVVLAEKKEI